MLLLSLALRAAPAREVRGTPQGSAAAHAPAGGGSYTGPGSCAAAACHGSIRPVAGSRIQQTEYSTWIAQDRHARAFEVLSNPVSQRIGRLLKIGPPNAAPKCLGCHALDVPEGRQARTFANEGVSCEACHGPASGWLGPHTTRNWTHQQSLQLGMYDTRDAVKRTEQCLTCHLGTAAKSVDHEMIAAGHPDLVFDLEAYSAAMPRHWRTPAAEPWTAVRTFAIGQLVHLRSGLDRLTRRVESQGWPEFSELDCFACHHSLTRPEDSWRQAQGYGDRRPGAAPLNPSRATTARRVLAEFDASAAADLDAVMTALMVEVARVPVQRDRIAGLVARARALVDRGVSRVTASAPDAATASRLLRAIAGDAEAIAPRGERAAEQAAMALDTLYAASRGTARESPAVREALDDLFRQFQSPSAYEPRRFVAQVRKLEEALGAP